MPEKGSPTQERDTAARSGRVSTEVKLALIEHALRPLAIFLVGLLLVVWLWPVRKNVELLKVGPLEAKIREQAEEKNVQKELQALEKLTDEQLQLFLIIGKDRRSELITYSGSEVSEATLQSLKAAGLLNWFEKTVDKNGYRWEASAKGYQLHQIIFNLMVDSIRRSADA